MTMSHPSWVCGLKLAFERIGVRVSPVTPFVGVWIETRNTSNLMPLLSHTLRGCVD